MNERLNGKVALVTGGAKGIGRTISRCLAAEGAKVMMMGRDKVAGKEAEAEITAAGGTARFVVADVGDEAAVSHAVAETVREFGSLTTLVNNAVAIDLGSLDGAITKISLEGWNRLLRVNLTGTFLACKYAIPEMLRAGGGSIISISSLAGSLGLHTITAYATAKGGMNAMMRSIATDYGKQKIRANAVVLGMIPHDALTFCGEEPFLGPNLDAHVLPYLGLPEDAGYACVYLASDESRFVTASEMRVDGGGGRLPSTSMARGYSESTAPGT